MSRSLASVVFSTFILTSMFTTAFNIRLVKAKHARWIIDDDGLTDFQSIQQAINSASEGDTIFVSNGTYYENVVINKTIVLTGEDKHGAIVDGNRSGTVIQVTSDNVTINGLTILNSHRDLYGIYVNSSSNCLLNNIVAENRWGIHLDKSDNNTLTSNSFFNNTLGIYMKHSDNTTVERNNFTDNSGGVYMTYSHNCRFFENIMLGSDGAGIMNVGGSYSTYDANTFMRNARGINLVESCFNQLLRNIIVNNSVCGIRMEDLSFENFIFNNNISRNGDGVWTHASSSHSIVSNTIAGNTQGLALNGNPGGNMVVRNNNVINNTVGVNLWHTVLCEFSQNNFISNDVQALSEDSADKWDAGYPCGGNYWSDYNGSDNYTGLHQNLTGRDGIGDTTYVINAHNRDSYPLMGVFHSYKTSMRKDVEVITNSTIDCFEYCEPCGYIRILASNTTTDQKYGFCRITIPHSLIPTPYRVVISGSSPVYWNYTLYDNGTHRWIYFEYEHSTREIFIVPEYPWLLTLILFTIVTFIIIIGRKKKQLLKNRIFP